MGGIGHGTTKGEIGMRAELRRATWRLAALYWLSAFVMASAVWHFAGVDAIASAPGKLAWIGVSVAITSAISALLYRLRNLSFVSKAALCFAVTLLCSPLSASFDFAIATWRMWPEPPMFTRRDIALGLIENSAYFFGWACLYVALLYSFEVREQEQRLAAIREEALTAQMRALRYQISPHFLFNTFNSIAALIEEGAPDQANRMVAALAGFMRTTLVLDPFSDVRLDQEIALQEDYLAIERERFSDRLSFSVDLPTHLRGALLPSLILQPAIENAVKHGMSGRRASVAIHVIAKARADVLIISVVNDAAPDTIDPPRTGTGTGLANIRERLGARFGEAGSCRTERDGEGKWITTISLPLRYA